MAFSDEGYNRLQMRKWKKNKVKSSLENKLLINFTSGKELNGWFFYKDRKILRVTIPKGRDELKIGTQNSIRNKLRLSANDFDDLINWKLCSERNHLMLSSILSSEKQNSLFPEILNKMFSRFLRSFWSNIFLFIQLERVSKSQGLAIFSFFYL
jgi:hypothetical protein